jgi:hypothetical protein
MNLIQENTKDVKWFTSMREVEKWMEINFEDYDWHFSDVESEWTPLEDPRWVTGRELKLKINEFDYQFVWAVISAFPLGTQPRLSKKPYADGNPDFWKGIPEKQLKDSLFEIICWDSSATLWIGLPEELGLKVLKNAPGIAYLNELNKKTANKT